MAAVDIKPFSDVVTALERVGKDVVKLKDIAPNQRKEYLDTLDSTFNVLDHAILMIVHSLSDLLNHDFEGRKDDVLKGLNRLGSMPDWLAVERSVGVCSELRRLQREMETRIGSLTGRVVTRDWEQLNNLINKILPGEKILAMFISGSLTDLSKMARPAQKSDVEYEKALDAIRQTRDKLIAQHRALISTQRKFFKYI